MSSSAARAFLALGLFGLAACGPAEPVREAQPSTAQATSAAFQVENSAVLPLNSAVLNRGYEIYVKTPPGYGKPENAGKRYPAIYLTDGPYTFQVASGVSRLTFSQGLLNEFVIVGVSWGSREPPADSRRRDLTPWPDAAIEGATGGGPAYLKFLKTEVMPLVEGRYRIDPAQRTLSGQSYGGLFGLWIVLTEPALFANYILTSPSIWFAEQEILNTEAAYAASHKDLKARIYLASGDREHPGPGGCPGCDHDMNADQQTMADRLRARNYPGLEIRSETIPGTFHETTFPVGLINGMQWLYLKP
ncbi:MAG: alpha/beta hydrolase-fold protein [Phenylobacterium sp.]|uniref:alpha/beta hydrolase n=1 Tax=Phenylobacterium sp. TaxID=1871053 RepID=UPI0027342AE7|nr:alpha/beta hydrolase-fold protein [Phenylobacterium sp.]MDP3745902.1 alpha/beta hydrolase-fold protein [Phenylobacterium sp.]